MVLLPHATLSLSLSLSLLLFPQVLFHGHLLREACVRDGELHHDGGLSAEQRGGVQRPLTTFNGFLRSFVPLCGLEREVLQ